MIDATRTVGDALDAWLRSIADQRSHDEYESRLKLYVRPTLDRTPLVSATNAKSIELRTALESSDDPISNATINALFASLSSAYDYFVEQGWCSENPPRLTEELEVAERPFTWLQSAGEVQKFLSACNDNIRTLVAVLVGTGLRLDEALHLAWVDVDLAHRVILVHRGRRGALKAGRLHHVPIFNSVLSVLREMKPSKGKNTLLWPGAKRDEPRAARAQQDERVPSLQGRGLRAGLPKKLRIHDMRHTFAGLFLASGGDVFKLSKILGHSSVAITQKVYAHLHPEAFADDYSRVAFEMPEKAGAVLRFPRSS